VQYAGQSRQAPLSAIRTWARRPPPVDLADDSLARERAEVVVGRAQLREQPIAVLRRGEERPAPAAAHAAANSNTNSRDGGNCPAASNPNACATRDGSDATSPTNSWKLLSSLPPARGALDRRGVPAVPVAVGGPARPPTTAR
jgi:hypothetical protein